MLRQNLYCYRNCKPRRMGQIPAHQRQDLLRFRTNEARDRARNRPHGRKQQRHLPGAHQSQDFLDQSCKSHIGGSPWYHEGKHYNWHIVVVLLSVTTQFVYKLNSYYRFNTMFMQFIFLTRYQ